MASAAKRRKRKRSKQRPSNRQAAIVDLSYGIVFAALALAMVAGALLTLYAEGDTFAGTVVVGCSLYVAFLGSWLVRRGVRKL